MKVVINVCYGGFSLSPEATLKLYERGVTEIAKHVDEYWPPARRAEEDAKYKTLGYNANLTKWREYQKGPKAGQRTSLFITVFSPDEQYVLNAGREIKRDHPELVRVVEEMGEAADGACAKLRVVEIPDGTDYIVDEYDGNEHIAETHRTWS
jgi:hypothetical protein